MMAERVAGGKTLPAEVLQRIVERTDGVPLFVEELTKAILESGHLKETNEHYELTGTLPALAIPATLQDSLMARLDRLMTAKVIAQLGAVMGRQFSYELLHTVSALDDATLQRELSRLVEAELVYQRGFPPQATYLFKHALVQDAAYESLLRSPRQQYHTQIVHVLEKHFPKTAQTQPELLAYHYTQAGLNEQAVSYWHRAGAQTIQRSAHIEAIHHLKTGLELLATLPESPERIQQELDVQITLGSALTATQGWGTAAVERAYLRARDLCQQVEESSQLFSTLNRLCKLYVVRGSLQTARELAEQFLTLAQCQEDTPWLAMSHAALGEVLWKQGAFPQACTHLEQSAAYSSPQGHDAQVADFDRIYGILRRLIVLPRVLWTLGYPDQALTRSQDALTFAQELSRPFELAITHH
jgi:predicted ATPase